MKPFVGLDIGGTKCAVTLCRVDGGLDFIKKLRFDSDAALGPGHMLKALYEAVDALLTLPETSSGIEAIGVSCGGPLDSKSGVVLCPPNLPGWVNVPLVQMLKERYGVPAFLMNDANACALAEWKLGAGRGLTDMIFLTMGTGMGGGVIAGGQLLTGASDMAGEIGHLRLSESGPVGFGKAGSFEGFTSGGGIRLQILERTRTLCKKGTPPAWTRDGVQEKDLSARLLAEYAKKGDPDALTLWQEIGKMLGKGLALLTDAFNPQAIVIGSIFARSGDLFKDAMWETLKEEAIPFSVQDLRVLPAELSEQLGDAAAIMSALYPMGIDPMASQSENDGRVLYHFERLFERYPALILLRESVMDAYLMLRDTYERGHKLLLCGNGGSCADCEHIAGELMKGFYLKRPVAQSGILSKLQGGLPAIALTGHSALSTAFANDVDPLLTYAQQTLALGQKGDCVICISTSGNAKNVLNAALAAKELGLKTLALTGGSGGELAKVCDKAIIAPGHTPADVQECHLPLYHTLCAMLEAHFYKE